METKDCITKEVQNKWTRLCDEAKKIANMIEEKVDLSTTEKEEYLSDGSLHRYKFIGKIGVSIVIPPS